MKIIAGQFKGRNFFMPTDIRPTQNIVRKSLFDMLGQDLEGISFVDIFAGSGGVGFEAMSRGAESVTFVEKDPVCARMIEENAQLLFKNLSFEERPNYGIINSDGFASIKTLAQRKLNYDIVFIDPPYSRGLAKKALKTIDAYDIVKPTSIVIIQHEKREALPEESERFTRFREKKYGGSLLSFYEPKG